MPAWPSDLPGPLRSGYGADVGGNVQRTDFDSGPARQRLRYGDAPDVLSAGFIFSAAQMVTFKAFWKTDINNGSDWFTMDLKMGNGLVNYEVRFIGGGYQQQILANDNWQVSAQFDVREIG